MLYDNIDNVIPYCNDTSVTVLPLQKTVDFLQLLLENQITDEQVANGAEKGELL